MISSRDIAHYHEQGYILVDDVLDGEQVSAARRTIDRILAGAKGIPSHDETYDFEPTHTPDDPRVRRIKKPHTIDPLFWDLVKTPRMVAILTKLLGPKVRLHGSKLNIKAPRYGSPVEWHQDWAFYPHTNDDILAVGVMLDDVLPENGPMLVLPGSHKGPTYNHHAQGRFCGAIDPASSPLDFKSSVPATGKAGSCSFHHVRLVHGSAQNTSDKPRLLLLYECAAADAWPLVNWTNLEEFDSRMICGEPTLEPRTASGSIRMPYPGALNQGSIYENQTVISKRYFDVIAD
ncbi:MAG: phytanoyl-CoA dioxygenase family protein [Pseudomonadota bacterium]|nr:phytanoyl-CoA dioxygenase family protein [Pseudomonadota bacterium]